MPSANRRLKRSVRITTEGRRVVLYIRYSSRMQEDGWSLEAQRRILEAYCQERGWDIVAVFVDEAKSAKDDDRPGFQEMMAFVRAGHVDRILVHKLDRFSRNLRTLLAYVEELERRGIALVCSAQPIDTGDPVTGKLILVILGVLAEMYLVTLSEETIKGKRERAEQGLWLGMLPWGYTASDDDGGHQAPVLDREKAALWRAAADLYDPLPPRPRPDGLGEMRSWRHVAEWLNAHGARMANRTRRNTRREVRNPEGLMLEDTVADMLQNLFYAGYIVYDDPDTGKQWLFPGQHEAVTDRAQIERIRAKSRRRLSLHTREAGVRRVYTANGIVRCAGCGAELNVANSVGGKRYTCRSKRRGVMCPASRHSIKVDELDHLLDELVASLQLPPDWQHSIVDALRQDSSAVERQQRRAELQARLARVHDRYEIGGFAGKEAYRARVAELQAQIESLGVVGDSDVIHAGEIVASLAELWALPPDVQGRDQASLDDVPRARLYEHIGERRAFLQMAFQRLDVDLDEGRLTRAELRPPFHVLARLMSTGIPPPISDAGSSSRAATIHRRLGLNSRCPLAVEPVKDHRWRPRTAHRR